METATPDDSDQHARSSDSTRSDNAKRFVPVEDDLVNTPTILGAGNAQPDDLITKKPDSQSVPERRFSARLNCPHCNNPIEIISDSVDADVLCPSCGSAVHLDTGRTLTWDKKRLPVIAQFELIEAVGRGAFGTVYKARDLQLQRIVAVKIPRSGVLETDEDEDRFVREARNVAQLRHPGIVAIHSVGRSDTFPYLVSEFVEGVTLSQYLTAKRFNFKDAAILIREVSIALEHAHSHGVIHRDLKPSNIMLTVDLRPRIMDFGFAKRDAGEITMTLDGQVLGTPAYMSPEQARGKSHEADARSDIYSVGVILFQLLTAELPFRGEVRMLLHQVIHDEPPSPRKFNHRMPRDLETICLKCMAKEPNRRYASAGELADDVERYLNGKPILARPVSRIEEVWRWCRRNPMIASLSTSAALLLALTAMIATFAYFRESHFLAESRTFATEKAEFAENERIAREEAQNLAAQESEARKLAVQQEKLAKRYLYAAHMNLAQKAWEDNRVGEVVRLLDLYRAADETSSGKEDLRGFEWYYWDRLSHSDLLTLKGHVGPVKSIAFRPDGKQLASAGGDLKVRVWDSVSGQEQLLLTGRFDGFDCVAYSPDGQRLALAGWDQTIRIWDANNGTLLQSLNGHLGRVNCVTFSPDGARLASASEDETVKIWHATDGKELRSIAGLGNAMKAIAYSPDGVQLASAAGWNGITVWDASTGDLVFQNKDSGSITSLAYRPDGKVLAAASRDHTIAIFDATTGKSLQILNGHSGEATAVAWSPDGQLLASASEDQTIKLWDASSGEELLQYKGHSGKVNSVAFSPDSLRVASASDDGTVKIWDTFACPEPSTVFLACSNFWNSPPFAYSPNGKHMAMGNEDGSIEIQDATTGEQLLNLNGHSNLVNSIVYGADGLRLASASDDNTVRVWDTNDGNELLLLAGHTDRVARVAFSPDCKRLASSSFDGTLKLWDAISGKLIMSTKTGAEIFDSQCAAFSPNSRQLAAAFTDDENDELTDLFKTFDAATGDETLAVKGEGNYELIMDVDFSPDGIRLATASSDKTAKLWDATSGRELLTLSGHTDALSFVKFSPDGKRIATASRDKTIKIWDPETGQVLITFKGETKGVVWHPDGRRIASTFSVKVTEWDSRTAPEVRDRTIRLSAKSGMNMIEHLSLDFGSGRNMIQSIRQHRALDSLQRRKILAIVERVALTGPTAKDSNSMRLRVVALLSFATCSPNDVPRSLSDKWPAQNLAAELLREAIQTAEECRAIELVTNRNLYDAACCFSLCRVWIEKIDMPEKDGLMSELQTRSLQTLKTAIAAGWNDSDHLADDDDLSSLRALPEFQSMLEELRTRTKSP